MTTLSNIYHANFKKIRGKAAQGFVRPTLSEFFMSHKYFVEIESAAGGWVRTLAEPSPLTVLTIFMLQVFGTTGLIETSS